MLQNSTTHTHNIPYTHVRAHTHTHTHTPHTHAHTHPTQSLGQTGKVAKVLPSKDVQVTVGERRWVFNPSCLLPATPTEESSPQSEHTSMLY